MPIQVTVLSLGGKELQSAVYILLSVNASCYSMSATRTLRMQHGDWRKVINTRPVMHLTGGESRMPNFLHGGASPLKDFRIEYYVDIIVWCLYSVSKPCLLSEFLTKTTTIHKGTAKVTLS